MARGKIIDQNARKTAMPRYSAIKVMRVKSHKEKKTRADYQPIKYDGPRPILDVMTAKRTSRFWSRIDRSAGLDGCWPWIGSPGPNGYGLLQGSDDYRGFSLLAHRIAFALYHQREPAAGLVVRHSCDNPPCCNPAHLIEGTHQDNYDDAVQRGRMPHPNDPFMAKGKRGAAANAADYTEEERRRAATLRYHDKLTIAAIAETIGAHRTTIIRWLGEHQASLIQKR
jgi:HNH endonuclease/Putative ATPase subunit of terminase (gpP-like)